MPQVPDATAIESNFGACEERGLESSPSDESSVEEGTLP